MVQLLWSCGDFSSTINIFASRKEVPQTQGNHSKLRCSTILLCNSERELEAYVQYIFNNTFPLLPSLRRLKLSCLSKNKDTKEVTI